jgi:hypothetical protein
MGWHIVNAGIPMQGVASGASTVIDRRAVTAARCVEGAPIDGGGAGELRRYAAHGAARREFGIVFALAFCGIALVLLVVFAPWYESVMAGGTLPSVARTPSPGASANGDPLAGGFRHEAGAGLVVVVRGGP